MDNVVPLHDNIIVRPIKITERDGGFVRPQQEEDKSELGEVIKIGIAVLEMNHKPLKVGDIVLYNKYSSTKTDLGEELIVRFEDIVGIIKK